MAEPVAQLEGPPPESRPAAPSLPGTLGSLRPPLLNIVLFVLTGASAFVAGAVLQDSALPAPATAEMVRHGLAFAAALLAILLSREMGHFLLARRHGVDATWPFFIPAPLLSLIGTLGAVIKLRSLPRTRAALFDVGVAGPLAGFAVTLPLLALGLWLSPVVSSEPLTRHWTLARTLASFATTGHFLSMKDGFELGEPLAMKALQWLVVGALPAGKELALHPLAIAGWFGLFLTALNLLPCGQLDGGHLVYAASPRVHRAIGPPVSGLLIGLGVFSPFVGWLIWGLLTGLVLNRHPPLAEPEARLDGRRRLLLALAVAVFVVSFVPAPLAPLAAG